MVGQWACDGWGGPWGSEVAMRRTGEQRHTARGSRKEEEVVLTGGSGLQRLSEPEARRVGGSRPSAGSGQLGRDVGAEREREPGRPKGKGGGRARGPLGWRQGAE